MTAEPPELAKAETGFFRHPLVLTVVGFALTGVLGSLLTMWIAQQSKDVEEARQQMVSRKTAVQTLSKYIYERRARAEMLASSIRRQAPIDEVRERKRLYDDTYVKWNTDNQANLFLVRDVLGEQKYSLFEAALEFQLVSTILAPLDSCLTLAYDHTIAGRHEEALQTLDACESRVLLKRALDCGYAITDELYKTINEAATRNSSLEEIDLRCAEVKQ